MAIFTAYICSRGVRASLVSCRSRPKTLFILTGLLLGWAPDVMAARPIKLNVLFIMADDLGNVVNRSDARHPVQTPSLTKFAKSAVTFDHAYCQIPLCNPSRASIFTGLRPDQTGVFDLGRHFRDQIHNVETLPELLRDNGWTTARIGKIFHQDVPNGIGTDGLDDHLSWDTVLNPKGRDIHDEAAITNPIADRPISSALSWLKASGEDGEQTDGMIADEAIKWINQHKAEPFFLGVGFFRPHTPYVAPAAYFDLYPIDQIRMPTASKDDRDDIPFAAYAHNNLEANYGLDDQTCRKALQAYYASVSFVDSQIGRLIDGLNASGVGNQTLVIVCSDHGYHLGEHNGIWQKRTLWEESTRTPLLIRVPGAAGNGSVCNRVVELIDLYPTIAELSNLAASLDLPGRSLMPLLETPSVDWHSVAVTQVLRPKNARFEKPVMGRTVRTERWRYTQWNQGADGQELYDHANDPHEVRNLAKLPEWKSVIDSLQLEFSGRASGEIPSTPFDPARL